VTDTNGCRFQDSIHIFVEGSLYIPNTFTPNRDGLNDLFRAYGVDIREFTMRIFNRWGEEIFVTEKLQSGWDGTYKNSECPLGVYVWKVDYTEVSGKGGQLIGHVNLLR
jgi:gliding motility-associated-like protein